MHLLILPISFFARFSNLVVGRFKKFSLWSLNLMSLLSKHINKNHIGLYRDDGFSILKNISGPAVEKLKKKNYKLFKEKDLDNTVQCNLKITNYRDISLNLNDGSYRPYRKPNEETNYIHINSNHPLSIIKEIPRSIEKRLNFVIIKKYFSGLSHLL